MQIRLTYGPAPNPLPRRLLKQNDADSCVSKSLIQRAFYFILLHSFSKPVWHCYGVLQRGVQPCLVVAWSFFLILLSVPLPRWRMPLLKIIKVLEENTYKEL